MPTFPFKNQRRRRHRERLLLRTLQRPFRKSRAHYFYDARISLTDTEAYYSYRFHIGLIAGELRENHTRKGEINHVYLDGEINLGNQALGELPRGSWSEARAEP